MTGRLVGKPIGNNIGIADGKDVRPVEKTIPSQDISIAHHFCGAPAELVCNAKNPWKGKNIKR